jgi:hypothetical protein
VKRVTVKEAEMSGAVVGDGVSWHLSVLTFWVAEVAPATDQVWPLCAWKPDSLGRSSIALLQVGSSVVNSPVAQALL